MLEVYRHGGSGRQGSHHHHHLSTTIQPYRGHSGFGGFGDWADVLMPRSATSPSSSPYNIWDVSPSKLRTAALASTFVVTAGYISMLAAGGLLAILVTGAVVTCCVLLTVLTCATLITLIVTGVPVGYAIFRLMMSGRKSKAGGGGGGGGNGGLLSGLFSGQQHSREHEHEETPHNGAGGGSVGGYGSRPYGGGAGVNGWQFRTADADDADDED